MWCEAGHYHFSHLWTLSASFFHQNVGIMGASCVLSMKAGDELWEALEHHSMKVARMFITLSCVLASFQCPQQKWGSWHSLLGEPTPNTWWLFHYLSLLIYSWNNVMSYFPTLWPSCGFPLTPFQVLGICASLQRSQKGLSYQERKANRDHYFTSLEKSKSISHWD